MDATFNGYSKWQEKAQALRTGGTAAVRQALLDTRERTLELADAYALQLAGDGLRIPYSAQVNPPLWELGHLAWFQEYWTGRNRQRALGIGCDPTHERLPSLLEHGDTWYDSSRVEHRSRWSLPLPDARSTRAYLSASLEQTLEMLDGLPPDAGHDALYFYRLAALHEAMHAEAATYMARGLGVQLPRPANVPERSPLGGTAVLAIPAQIFRLGAARQGFAFDNELGAHDVQLESYKIDAQPVSWARFHDFDRAQGYQQRRWWTDAGWEWLRERGRPQRDGPASGTDAPAVHRSTRSKRSPIGCSAPWHRSASRTPR